MMNCFNTIITMPQIIYPPLINVHMMESSRMSAHISDRDPDSWQYPGNKPVDCLQETQLLCCTFIIHKCASYKSMIHICVQHTCIMHICVQHTCMMHICVQHTCMMHICVQHTCMMHICVQHTWYWCTWWGGSTHVYDTHLCSTHVYDAHLCSAHVYNVHVWWVTLLQFLKLSVIKQ